MNWQAGHTTVLDPGGDGWIAAALYNGGRLATGLSGSLQALTPHATDLPQDIIDLQTTLSTIDVPSRTRARWNTGPWSCTHDRSKTWWPGGTAGKDCEAE